MTGIRQYSVWALLEDTGITRHGQKNPKHYYKTVLSWRKIQRHKTKALLCVCVCVQIPGKHCRLECRSSHRDNLYVPDETQWVGTAPFLWTWQNIRTIGWINFSSFNFFSLIFSLFYIIYEFVPFTDIIKLPIHPSSYFMCLSVVTTLYIFFSLLFLSTLCRLL